VLYSDNGPFQHLSVIGLGCWNFGGQWNKVSKQDAISIIRYAIDHGINYVDVAESYGIPDGQCEMILGEALQDGYRDKVFLVSKVAWYGRRTTDCFFAKETRYTKLMRKLYNKLNHMKPVDMETRTPDLVRLSGHACCGRLRTDFIDLLLCHDGNTTHPEVFIEGFRQLKSEGFIRYYGISTDRIDVLKRFYELSDGECSACECDYSLLNRNPENEIFSFCKEHNIAIFTRGTLMRGILSGNYNQTTEFKELSRKQWNVGEKDRWIYELYLSLIDKFKLVIGNEPLARCAYRFAFTRPEHPSVVIGCTSMEQMMENIETASDYLSQDIFDKLDSIRG